MKTSNKLLIGLLLIIFVVMSAAFIEIRVFGVHRSANNPISKSRELPLGDFRYVCIENVKFFKIEPSNRNHIHFVSYNDTVNFNINYTIENDTLKVLGVPSPSFNATYTLYLKSNIESLVVNSSEVRISGLEQDSIRFHLWNASVRSYRNTDEVLTHFVKASVEQENATINFHNAKIDSLKIQMERSSARFDHEMEHIQASIQSASELYIKDAGKIELSKDESSRFRLW